MKKKRFLPLIAGFSLASMLSAPAVFADIILPSEFVGLPGDNPALDGHVGETQWATSLLFNTFTGQPADRDDPLDALGAPDGEFFEVGFRNVAAWGFDDPIERGWVSLFEVTNGNVAAWPERARILGATKTDTFFNFIGDVFNVDAQNGYSLYVDLGSPIDAIMVQDLSSRQPFEFDVDAVGLTPKLAQVQAQVPAPPPLALLGAGLLGIAASRRRARALS